LVRQGRLRHGRTLQVIEKREWQFMENKAGQGMARQGKSSQGKARQVRGWHGWAGQGVHVVAKHGMAGQAGRARQVKVREGKAR
jgi:hypothetical protein